MVGAAAPMRVPLNDLDAAPLPLVKKLRVGMVALFAAMGSFLFGLDIGYIGPILSSDSFKKDVFGLDAATQIDPVVQGWVVSLFSVGAMVGAFPPITSYFLDAWGRKSSIMGGSVVFILGGAIQACSYSEAQILVGRFVAGSSIGILSSVIVLYQSELAPPSLRGALATLYQLGITFGILIAAFIDELLVTHAGGWRVVMAIMTLPAGILLVGMLFLPRSPRWLAQQGRNDEALAVLKTIRNEDSAEQELREIQEELAESAKDGEPRWSELFQGRVLRLVALGVVLQLLQQLVGMNAFMYFGPEIFESMKFDKNKFTTINNLVNFLSTFPAVFLADRAGRRVLMLLSAIFMFLSCMVMGVLGMVFMTHTKVEGTTRYELNNETAGYAIAVSVFFFVFNFAYGFGPIVWVYIAEIMPLRYRARANGVSTMANWVGNFIIAQFTPWLLSTFSFGTFFFFGFFCLVGIAVSWWIPETKGVPLESVGELFNQKRGFRKVAAAEKEAVERQKMPA